MSWILRHQNMWYPATAITPLLGSGMSRTQIHITIGLLLLAHLLLAPLGLRVDRVPTPADLLVLGALIAQPPLLAIWAVLAPQAFVRRFFQATMALACVYLTVDFAAVRSSANRDMPGEIMLPLAWLISFLVCQLPLWLLRARFRWQLEPPATFAVGPKPEDNRFSLRGLLVAIALVATMLATMRWLHPARVDIHHVAAQLLPFSKFGAAISLLGLLVAALCWMVLMPGRLRWRWMIGIASACLVAYLAVAAAAGSRAGVGWEASASLPGTWLCATFTLLVIRFCGYRLVRKKSGGEREPKESPSVALVPASSRRFAVVCSSMAVLLAAMAALTPARLHLLREKAEERRWRDLGWYVVIRDGQIIWASTHDGSQHALSADAIDRLGSCPDLTRIDLAGSTVDDETLERLPALPSLTSLSLTATRVSDNGLRYLTKFTNLRDLGLRLTDSSDEGLAVLATLNQGTAIDLGNTRVSPQGVTWLRQRRPDLRINDKTDDFSLGRLATQFRPRLTAISQPADRRPVVLRMHARGTGVTDTGVAALRGMTNIEELDLENADVTDGAINDLATLSGLKKVVLKGTQVSNSGIARLKEALPDCTIDH